MLCKCCNGTGHCSGKIRMRCVQITLLSTNLPRIGCGAVICQLKIGSPISLIYRLHHVGISKMSHVTSTQISSHGIHRAALRWSGAYFIITKQHQIQKEQGITRNGIVFVVGRKNGGILSPDTEVGLQLLRLSPFYTCMASPPRLSRCALFCVFTTSCPLGGVGNYCEKQKT